MDMFSADLPVGAFSKTPAPMTRPTIDLETAELLRGHWQMQKDPFYTRVRCSWCACKHELTALAEALEVPVAILLWVKAV